MIKGLKNYLPNSGKKANWICKKCHNKWPAQIASRNRGCGCPYCKGAFVSKENSFASKYPELAKLWDYDLNFPDDTRQSKTWHS